tara:strand:+ start:723 stop:1028 length:306 start_codon:yes stop_codon:yes gene_type:complete
MTGYIVNEATANAILAGIDAAMDSRNLPHYWTVGKYFIHTGEHAGNYFLPFDDVMMATDLHRGMTPLDFPEALTMVESLGGLEARQELDPAAIIDPNAPQE